MQNMETLPAWTTLVVVGPTARQGEQEQHWDDRRSQGRNVMVRICPRRSGLERREGLWNHFYLGTAIDERHPSPGAPKAVAHRSTARKAAAVIAKWTEGMRMRSMRHRLPSGRGSVARKGLALERFEPCEAKVSRTVLRGAWAG
jgi:hypothetical protein